jgi:hypothetical protein
LTNRLPISLISKFEGAERSLLADFAVAACRGVTPYEADWRAHLGSAEILSRWPTLSARLVRPS